MRLSDRPFSSNVGFGSERGLPDMGSRLALLADDEMAVAVWTDTREGTEASNKQDLALAVVGFSKTPRSVPLLATCGVLVVGGGILLLMWGLEPRYSRPPDQVVFARAT